MPSLLHFGVLRPFTDEGALARVPHVIALENTSLGLDLTPQEMTGLKCWLRNCLRGGLTDPDPNKPSTGSGNRERARKGETR